MNSVLSAGAALLALGVLGYTVGVFVPYPGRAFSVTAFMTGVALVAIGRSAAFAPDADAESDAGAGTTPEEQR